MLVRIESKRTPATPQAKETRADAVSLSQGFPALRPQVARRFAADEFLMLEIKQTMGIEAVVGFKVCDDNV